MAVFGNWRPGEFPPWITLVAKLVLMGDMAVRGADYFFGDSADTARRLSEIESAAPLHWWGLACLVAAGLGFGGIILTRATPILWAHTLGAAIYTPLAVGILIDVVSRVDDATTGAAPAIVLVGVAVVLMVASRRSRSRQPLLVSLSALVGSAGIAVYAVGLDGIRSVTILAAIAVLHLLMALGTAARARQATLREARICE